VDKLGARHRVLSGTVLPQVFSCTAFCGAVFSNINMNKITTWTRTFA